MSLGWTVFETPSTPWDQRSCAGGGMEQEEEAGQLEEEEEESVYGRDSVPTRWWPRR